MPASQQVSIRVQTDGKATVKNDWAEIGQAGVDAQNRISQAADASAQAADRTMARWKQMAQAARDAQAASDANAAFNSVLGVGGSGKSAKESAAAFEELLSANENVALTNVQVMELTHSARALFDTLAAGGDPVRALAMESGRLGQTLGGGPGGLLGTVKALAGVVLPFAVWGAALAPLAAAGYLVVQEMMDEKAAAEAVKKAHDELTASRHAGMEAIKSAIGFAEKYHVSSDALYGSLENIITSQTTMNDVVRRGVGVTDDMARAARDRAEAERLLTVEMLRQAAAEATQRASADQKQIDKLKFGSGLLADLEVVGMAAAGQDVNYGRTRADIEKHRGIDQLTAAKKAEDDLAASLVQEATAAQNATLTIDVHNKAAEEGARKAAAAARKAAEEAKRRAEAEQKLLTIHDQVRLAIAKAFGSDTPEAKAAEYMAQERAAVDALTKSYMEALIPATKARAIAEHQVGLEMLAQAQAQAQATEHAAESIKLTKEWQAALAANPPIIDENARALDAFHQAEQSAFESLENNLTSGAASFKSFSDAVKNEIRSLVAEFEKLALFNPIENMLFGTNKPTIANIGGFFGSIFGMGGGGGSSVNFMPGEGPPMQLPPFMAGAQSIFSTILSAFPHFASGTDFAPGGFALVGERGPEVVRLPRGSQVFPNGAGPMGGVHVSVPVTIDARGADASAARNVQIAVAQLRAELPGIITATVNDGISRRRIRTTA